MTPDPKPIQYRHRWTFFDLAKLKTKPKPSICHDCMVLLLMHLVSCLEMRRVYNYVFCTAWFAFKNCLFPPKESLHLSWVRLCTALQFDSQVCFHAKPWDEVLTLPILGLGDVLCLYIFYINFRLTFQLGVSWCQQHHIKMTNNCCSLWCGEYDVSVYVA